jgi:hypothetical protein
LIIERHSFTADFWIQLQQLTKRLFGEAGITNDAAHRECVYRIVPWDRENPNPVGHDHMLALANDSKARLLQGPYGIQMVDAGDAGHAYAGTSTSRTMAPSSS